MTKATHEAFVNVYEARSAVTICIHNDQNIRIFVHMFAHMCVHACMYIYFAHSLYFHGTEWCQGNLKP